MCIGDWRLGRILTSVPRIVSIANGGTFTLPPSEQRVGVMFIPDSAVLQGSAQNILSNGVIVGTMGLVPIAVIFTLKDNGDLPTRQFEIVNAVAGAVTWGVTEWFLPEDVLQSGLESWQSEYKPWTK